MPDEPRRKTRYRGERCTSKLTLNSKNPTVVLPGLHAVVCSAVIHPESAMTASRSPEQSLVGTIA